MVLPEGEIRLFGWKKEGVFSMKRLFSLIAITGVISISSLAARAADSDMGNMAHLNQRLQAATTTLEQIMSVRDKAIPQAIASRAKCVAVVPSVIKGAVGIGAEYGQGVATCRTAHGWSGPVFIRLAGGSFGLQIGAKGTDLVLVAVNKRGMQDLLRSQFKIGASASAAAGPVGREAQAATDISMRAQLLTWSRSRGVFAGVDLNGVTFSQNALDTTTLYGGDFHRPETILDGRVPPPPAAKAFLSTVQTYFGEARERHGESTSPVEH